jgi:hypothetical protein
MLAKSLLQLCLLPRCFGAPARCLRWSMLSCGDGGGALRGFAPVRRLTAARKGGEVPRAVTAAAASAAGSSAHMTVAPVSSSVDAALSNKRRTADPSTTPADAPDEPIPIKKPARRTAAPRTTSIDAPGSPVLILKRPSGRTAASGATSAGAPGKPEPSMNQSGRRTAGTVSVDALLDEERTAPSTAAPSISSASTAGLVLAGKKKPGCTSKYVGVCWDARYQKWRAQVFFGGATHFLGYFDIEEEAGRACLDAAPRRELTSSYLGVSWCKKSRKWRAEVRVDRKLHVLGFFEAEIDAARAFVIGRSRLRAKASSSGPGERGSSTPTNPASN